MGEIAEDGGDSGMGNVEDGGIVEDGGDSGGWVGWGIVEDGGDSGGWGR